MKLGPSPATGDLPLQVDGLGAGPARAPLARLSSTVTALAAISSTIVKERYNYCIAILDSLDFQSSSLLHHHSTAFVSVDRTSNTNASVSIIAPEYDKRTGRYPPYPCPWPHELPV